MQDSIYEKRGFRIIAILCSAFAMGSTATTHATDLVGPDVTVHYRDLAIGTEQGASRLLKRIEWAASRVCARLDHGSLPSRANMNACREKLSAAAVSKVNHPMLLAVYNSSRDTSHAVARLTK
jgi:UrcA family protein